MLKNFGNDFLQGITFIRANTFFTNGAHHYKNSLVICRLLINDSIDISVIVSSVINVSRYYNVSHVITFLTLR
jgi:hypothetical protein